MGSSTGPHLHFALYYNGAAELPEPMSGYTGFVNNSWYTSDNIWTTSPGQREDNTTHYQILGCYNLQGGASKVGWPIDDGSGSFVHKWLPWHYDCQNFRNAEGQESIIMYGSLYCNQAYLVVGDF